jgi:hypothetical protein
MPSILNASTASGGGIIASGDSSGILQLQTGGTTAVIVDASQNVSTSGQFTCGGILNTGSTGQVKFPATQNPSSDANTLDDYEEGTWTPVVTNTGFGSGTLNGTYTKIGRVVTITANLQLTSVGTASGTLTASGLPFTPSYQAYGTCRETASTGVIYYPTIDTGVANVNIQNSTNGGISWTNGYIYRLSITYITAT